MELFLKQPEWEQRLARFNVTTYHGDFGDVQILGSPYRGGLSFNDAVRQLQQRERERGYVTFQEPGDWSEKTEYITYDRSGAKTF